MACWDPPHPTLLPPREARSSSHSTQARRERQPSRLRRCRDAGADHGYVRRTEAPSVGARLRSRWHVGIPLILPFSRQGRRNSFPNRVQRGTTPKKTTQPPSMRGVPRLITFTLERTEARSTRSDCTADSAEGYPWLLRQVQIPHLVGPLKVLVGEGIYEGDGFARALHLGAELFGYLGEFIPREDRFLDRIACQ